LLKAQLAQVTDQVSLQQQQAASAQALLERIRPLGAKGYVSALQIQQQEAAVLDARTQFRTLVRQQLDARQALATVQQQLDQLPLDASTRQNETERQLADIRQSIAQNEMQRAILLRAPRDGTVSAVIAKAGQTVAAAQPLLSVLPAGSRLQALLLVPSRAIGFVEPGSRVVLRYAAFPYQKFGQQYGRVTEISRSALSPAEVGALVGQQTKEPLYRVQVALERQAVPAYGKAESLKAGMALQADILMERRRLIEWAFEPLYGIGHRLAGGPSHG
jgi:membrane fusion protein